MLNSFRFALSLVFLTNAAVYANDDFTGTWKSSRSGEIYQIQQTPASASVKDVYNSISYGGAFGNQIPLPAKIFEVFEKKNRDLPKIAKSGNYSASVSQDDEYAVATGSFQLEMQLKGLEFKLSGKATATVKSKKSGAAETCEFGIKIPRHIQVSVENIHISTDDDDTSVAEDLFQASLNIGMQNLSYADTLEELDSHGAPILGQNCGAVNDSDRATSDAYYYRQRKLPNGCLRTDKVDKFEHLIERNESCTSDLNPVPTQPVVNDAQ